jgi:two-component system NtrC family sensor kinase
VNLLLNACDACSPGGHVELHVLLREQQILFRVIDDGAGISQEAAARAMEPFFTTKPVGKGAGLGLAVTHEIIKSHRGSLRVGPRQEGGTCAEIVLPQAEESVAHGP